ncbi:MAG TPA: hypothetical protein VIH59_24000 [Candidatus Tectomicrobia bacterium]|jgi:hypothetical protein
MPAWMTDQVGLVLERGTTRRNIKGVMVHLRLSRAAARLWGVADNARPRPEVAYIKGEPKRIICWDYSQDVDSPEPRGVQSG